jgi:peptidoglycan/xylan/chitin deacetylase (PgdA/CDA1 family)
MSIRTRLRVRTRLRKVVRKTWPARPRPLILMYHRVAYEPVDCYYMTVSPGNFREHLDVLSRSRYPLALDHLVTDVRSGTLRHDAVAVTFDDGYVDNLTEAKPLLNREDIPATVFLTTGQIDNPEHFWWDELARLIFFEDGPQSFQLVLRGQIVNCDCGGEAAAREDGTIPTSSLTKRAAVLATLWQALRVLGSDERQSIILNLQQIFKNRGRRASLGRAMTRAEVRTLVADGSVSIGAHTVTHPVLTGLGYAACRRESIESKITCEELTGKPVVAFSYPYGDFDSEACEAVKACDFIFACGKQTGYVSRQSDVFTLPRVYVPNIDGDAFEQLLRSVPAVT